MPMSNSSSRMRACWASQPNVSTPKRWNRVVSPPVQSVWCRFTASMPASAERGGPPLGAFLHPPQPGGVDELHVGELAPPCSDRAPVVMAQPESLRGATARRPRHRHRRRRGRDVLHVERQLVLGTAFRVQVGQRRDVARQLGTVTSTDPAPAVPGADHAVVVEDGDTVRGEPDVALEARRAQSAAPARTPRVCSPAHGPWRPGARIRSVDGGGRGCEAGSRGRFGHSGPRNGPSDLLKRDGVLTTMHLPME